MGHYLSEMGEDRPVALAQSGYDAQEELDKFFGGTAPTSSDTCPRCGARISWTWTDVDSLLLHIKWHENLAAIVSHQANNAMPTIWTGEWPGVEECREMDLYVYDFPGIPGKSEDLNGLAIMGLTGKVVWSVEKERWIRP